MKPFSPTFLYGFILSLVAATVGLRLGSSPTDGFLIALLGISISLGLECISRIESASTNLSVLLKLTDATALSPRVRESFVRLANYWQILTSPGIHPAFVTSAFRDLDDYMERLKLASEQRVVVGADDAWPLREVLDCADRQISAVSMASTEWWKSEAGTVYLKRNIERVDPKGKHPIVIRRIFAPPILDDYQKALMKRMRDAGMEIRLLNASSVPKQLLRGCLIADTCLVQYTEYFHTGHPREHNLSANSVDVENASRNFELLWKLATPYE